MLRLSLLVAISAVVFAGSLWLFNTAISVFSPDMVGQLVTNIMDYFCATLITIGETLMIKPLILR